ncbi:hypothetical protein D4Z93_12320 [Clostridium fermenticellae]|uniref:DUF2232 domain-containing protein n=1 Tax=Clostridium fermenticellae TaxID=2068654 RepID=A0A386H6M1_9CLOT|nr:hypothetical protein [Clostridium fermenticellae]AYD41254.1 hypothetical protein D4Z93_12320 [Clostridium fermenticellae]
MNSIKNKSSYIAKGGLFTAVGVILVYLSTIFPVNRLFLLMIASCIIPMCVIDLGLKNALTIYLSTSLLSLLIGGIRATTIFYVVFFGSYGIIKYYIEKISKLYVEIILKLIFFNICLAFMYFTFKLFIANLINLNLSIYIVLIVVQFAFLIYDYAVTLFINYINNRFYKKKY